MLLDAGLQLEPDARHHSRKTGFLIFTYRLRLYRLALKSK
jgi:hypothetical protein